MRKVLRQVFLLLAATALLGVGRAQDSTGQGANSGERRDCESMSAAERAANPDCAPPSQRQQTEPQPLRTPELSSGRAEPAERRTELPLNPSDRRRVELPPVPKTEFEQLVADTVGRPLPLFGQSLFAQPPSTFAPTDRAQVPGDYVIGPDDELQIHVWGQLNAELRTVVDRSGQIYIPHVGQISVAGARYSELESRLKSEIGRVYRNFSLTVGVGRIRSIQVFVVGQARYPGSYTIGSLSTLVNAVFASGGPTVQGSLRDVQVQRAGQTIAHMDFYELLVRGDKSKDVRLQPGDVIYFPPVGALVAAAGSVNSPAIYELKPGSTIAELIEIAGGLTSVADSSKVTVERIGVAQARTVLEFPLDAESRAMVLNSGDIVRVFSIVPRFSNAVTLRGSVANPGRYPWKPGMRVRDLIPNAQALLTRPYWLGRAAMTDGRSTEYPVLAKDANSKTGQRRELRGEGLADERMAGRNDRTTENEREGAAETAGQEAAARRSNPPDSRSAAAAPDADGLTAKERRQRLNSETLTEDLHLASPEVNWNYAIVQRVNHTDLSSTLLSFDLAKAVLENDEANNLELQPDDIVTVFSQADVAVPQQQRARYVRLEGEIVRAGVYKISEGELLSSVLQRAGGVTPSAYLYGIQLTRESARAEQQKSINELARSMEIELRQAAVSSAAHSLSDDSGTIAARQASQEALITQLRQVKASGRVVLDLSPTANSIASLPAIAMEDNDRIYIPHLPATVSVVGMVYNPGSFVYQPRKRAGEYLKLAGRGRPNADMHHAFVLRADGTVVASATVNGVFAGDRFDSLHLYPGDQIVVPSKVQTGNLVRGLRDWSQITSQLALTGAALAVIK